MEEHVFRVPRKSDAEAVLLAARQKLGFTGEAQIARWGAGWQLTLLSEQALNPARLRAVLPKRLREVVDGGKAGGIDGGS